MAGSATPPAPDYGSDTYIAAESILNKLDAEEKTAESEVQETETAETETESEIEESETAEAETEAEPEQETEEAPSIYKVKVNGQEIEATLDELLNGYSRTQDYKAKTAEVAREREAIKTAREQYLTGLNQAIQYAQTFDPILAEGQSTDWVRLAQEDPAEYNLKRARYEQRVQQVNNFAAQQKQLQEQQLQSVIEAENQRAMETIPEWVNETTRDTLKAGIKTFYQDVGFSPEETSGFTDHRVLRAAALALQYKAKADKYDALQTAKKTAETKKVVTVPKVQKPSTGEPTKSQKAGSLKKQALRSGKTDDIVNAILANLED